jgi:ABC-type phosphate transport system permease subunit
MKIISCILAFIPTLFFGFFGCKIIQQASNALDHLTVWVVRGFGVFVLVFSIVLFFRIRSYLIFFTKKIPRRSEGLL